MAPRSLAWVFRTLTFLLLLSALLVDPHPVAAAKAEVGTAGAAHRWSVTGNREVSSDALLDALAQDHDLQWKGHPRAPRAAFLALLRERAITTLQHAGFPDARVEVKWLADDPTAVTSLPRDAKAEPRVELLVHEGARFRAGVVQVRGVDRQLVARLQSCLTREVPPPDATPDQSPTSSSSTGEVVWRAPDGSRALLSSPLWQTGAPAPFDSVTRENMRQVIARALKEEGFDAASFQVVVRREPQGSTARLEVNVTNPGPRAILRDLVLPANLKTSRESLVQYLQVKLESPVTDIDRLRWQRQLVDSGRFRRCQIDLRRRFGGDGVEAHFDLEEVTDLPPLGTPLAREQETLLRCRQWLVDWRAHEQDWVIERLTGESDTAGDTIRWIVSPREGVLVEYQNGAGESAALVASSSGLACYLTADKGKWEMPLRPSVSIVGSVSVTFADESPPPAHPHRLTFSLGLRSVNPRDRAAPVQIDLRIDPAVLLSSARQFGGSSQWDGNEWRLSKDRSLVRIDSKTGQLLEALVSDERGTWRITTRSQYWRQSVERLQAATKGNQYDANRPIGSALEFLASDSAWRLLAPSDATERQNGSSRHPLASLEFVRLLRQLAKAGTWDDLDAALVRSSAAGSDTDLEPLVVPAPLGQPANANPLRPLAGIAMRLSDLLFDRDEWPATLLRAGAGMLAGETQYIQYDVSRMYVSPEVGPVGFLAGSAAIPIPVMSATFAQEGSARLSLEYFQRDRDLLLRAVDRIHARETLVTVLRAIDDEQAARLGEAIFGEKESLSTLARQLREQPTVQAASRELADALDQWWVEHLKARVEAQLRQRSSLETARRPQP